MFLAERWPNDLFEKIPGFQIVVGGRTSSKFWMLVLAAPFLLALASLGPFQVHVPPHFPPPPCPQDNTLTEARVELGRKLFFDPVLSIDSSISCASCHKPALAFADELPVSPGVGGRLATRNAPSLVNLAYRPNMLRDGGVPTIEMQVLVPVQEHAEMDFNLLDIAARLRRDSAYTHMSRHAYMRAPDPYVVTRALSAYERTLISGDSEWDHFQQSPKKAGMSGKNKEGWRVFQKKGCINCHSGIFLTDNSRRNNGLKLQYADSGYARISEMPEDVGKFLVPGLRNLRHTAPYMHDGSLSNLESVVEHYAKGGSGHRNQDALIQPFTLSAKEKSALLHFLEYGLEDLDFLRRHSDDCCRPIPTFLTEGRP